MKWVWIGAAVLFGIAAVSVFFAFQRPDFVAGLTAAAIAAAFGAAWPGFLRIFRRKSPEEEAADRDRDRRGEFGPRRPPGAGR